MPVDADHPVEPVREGRLRSGVRKTLVYFGLAEEAPGTSPPRSAERQLVEVVLLAVVMALAVGDHRGATMGWVSAATFVPLLGAAVAQVARPAARRGSLPDPLAVPPIMLGAALWIVPRHTAVWIPIAVGVAVSASMIAAGWAANRGRPRRARLR
ncbi:MAG: hypothetical protein AAGC46_08140 [Solirubrobacteraceae bacterium]|nr:hypothetical protein [Patulibacter sp.]